MRRHFLTWALRRSFRHCSQPWAQDWENHTIGCRFAALFVAATWIRAGPQGNILLLRLQTLSPLHCFSWDEMWNGGNGGQFLLGRHRKCPQFIRDPRSVCPSTVLSPAFPISSEALTTTSNGSSTAIRRWLQSSQCTWVNSRISLRGKI